MTLTLPFYNRMSNFERCLNRYQTENEWIHWIKEDQEIAHWFYDTRYTPQRWLYWAIEEMVALGRLRWANMDGHDRSMLAGMITDMMEDLDDVWDNDWTTVHEMNQIQQIVLRKGQIMTEFHAYFEPEQYPDWIQSI